MTSSTEKALRNAQLTEILDYIRINHRFGKGVSIKYIEPVFDTRDGRYFHINFRYTGGEKAFDCRESEFNMYDEIMMWFKKEEEIRSGWVEEVITINSSN